MIKISFIIINYNTQELLKNCVDNLLKIKKDIPEVEIIVVDNGSVDGSAYMMEQEYTGKTTLIKTQNNGVSAGHNLGLEKAHGKYIIHLGTDALPDSDAIKRIYDFMENNPNVGLSTPKLVLRNGDLDMDAHRGALTPWVAVTYWSGLGKIFPKSKLFNGYYLGYKDFSVPHEIDVCISHFMVVRKEAQEKVGKWDEDFFLYGEDLDFCYRIKQSGYKIMYLSDISVLHIKGAGVGRQSSKDLDNVSKRDFNHLKKIRVETAKAMSTYYNKHLKKKYPFFITWLVNLGIFLIGRLRVIKYVLSGYGY